jgi:hypothetical protein
MGERLETRAGGPGPTVTILTRERVRLVSSRANRLASFNMEAIRPPGAAKYPRISRHEPGNPDSPRNL